MSICTFCDTGCFLSNTSAPNQSLFERPSSYCKNCSLNIDCTINTSLATLQVPAVVWQDSLHTFVIYKCEGNSVHKSINHPKDNINDYRIANHFGLLYKPCIENNCHFNRAEGKWTKCPDIKGRIIISCATFLVGDIISSVVYGMISGSSLKKYIEIVSTTVSRTNLQTKLKVLIYSLQVVASIEQVYGG